MKVEPAPPLLALVRPVPT